jgi:type I restriction enzyme M protein
MTSATTVQKRNPKNQIGCKDGCRPLSKKRRALALIPAPACPAWRGRAALLAEDPTAAEDPDEYLAENVFWVPKQARWSHLQDNAKRPTIGKLIDDAMSEIEKSNPGLKGVPPKDYNRPALDKVMLGELIDLVSGIGMGGRATRPRTFSAASTSTSSVASPAPRASAAASSTRPRSVVRVLAEMLEPYKGRVYDPCCGSGGMFVQSEKFVESHGGRIGDIAIYGQESNYTTWRLGQPWRGRWSTASLLSRTTFGQRRWSCLPDFCSAISE